jgi:hypothetical protein
MTPITRTVAISWVSGFWTSTVMGEKPSSSSMPMSRMESLLSGELTTATPGSLLRASMTAWSESYQRRGSGRGGWSRR